MERKSQRDDRDQPLLRKPARGLAWISLNVGWHDGFGPREIVDAIEEGTGMPGRSVGDIEITNTGCFAQVPEDFVNGLSGESNTSPRPAAKSRSASPATPKPRAPSEPGPAASQNSPENRRQVPRKIRRQKRKVEGPQILSGSPQRISVPPRRIDQVRATPQNRVLQPARGAIRVGLEGWPLCRPNLDLNSPRFKSACSIAQRSTIIDCNRRQPHKSLMSEPRARAKHHHHLMEAEAQNLPTRGAENLDAPQPKEE